MTKPQIEAIKEVGRWLACLSISWVLTQIINQITVIPLVHDLKIGDFHFIIPIREPFQMVLTMAVRFLDKLKFEFTKIISEKIGDKEVRKGILPF